jgi:hypothetical protein
LGTSSSSATTDEGADDRTARIKESRGTASLTPTEDSGDVARWASDGVADEAMDNGDDSSQRN